VDVREPDIVKEWKLEGRIEGMREMLRDLLQNRFGPLPEEWRTRLEMVSDPGRLRQAVLQVSRVSRLEDLSL
jgi:hypothetical protein